VTDEKPPPRGLLAILLGTAPGLERMLLSSVPALVVGSLVFFWAGSWPGLFAGLGALALGIVLTRRVGR
jgi:uncharacterized membrane protein